MIAAHKNVRILLSLLKQHQVRHFVLSPGSRNMSISKSVEDDPFFTCYSVVDERSAAYFAVGLSLELRSPVALSCTSAQATRNYIPGMTEAYYRRAPVLVITSDYDAAFIDQQNMQALRQMSIPSDSCKVSLDIPVVKDQNDEQLVTRRVNQAIDELTRHGGGPAHLNVRINQHWVRGEDELETARKITRHLPLDAEWPAIGARKTLLVVGQHHPFSESEARALQGFAKAYDAAVYVNHISNYHGDKAVHGNIRLATGRFGELKPDLLITIGGHLGDYPLDGKLKDAGIEHWRVGEDGNYCDTYNSLTRVFECPEQFFFERMARTASQVGGDEYYTRWMNEIAQAVLPECHSLSQLLVAQALAPLIPPHSNVHFAILNSLRFWEFVDLSPTLRCYSNVAGFGIDGCLSTFLGQSVASQALNFLIIGDLSFFYDMNSIGIRHLKNNIRIVLINNHGGGEFRLNTHAADRFGDASNRHIAGAGHFGDSAEGWVRNNHFKYLAVNRKEELAGGLQALVQPSERPVFLEVHTTMADDAAALQSVTDANDHTSSAYKFARSLKRNLKSIVKG
jgi:2-succinyl-5-enolpyruvyl-6-hydroxy-3-cyclohexene-1-carboxylate synthase